MKKIISIIFLALILAALFAGWKVFGPAVSTSHGDYLYIRTGENFEGFKDSLVSQKYLGGTSWFNMVSKVMSFKPETIKAGKYKVKNGMSLFSLVRMLKNGRQTPVNLVITKLRTKEDFAGKAGRMFECDSVQVINFLKIALVTPEPLWQLRAPFFQDIWHTQFSKPAANNTASPRAT